jgi:hypothetical protein
MSASASSSDPHRSFDHSKEDTMKAQRLILTILSGLSLVSPAAAVARDATPPSAAIYVASVDPGAFHEVPGERDKLGVTVSPASVRLITPGVDKFSIYPCSARRISPRASGEVELRAVLPGRSGQRGPGALPDGDPLHASAWTLQRHGV